MSPKMDKLEKMLADQAKLNHEFQHNILTAMNDNSNDEETEVGTQSQLRAAS